MQVRVLYEFQAQPNSGELTIYANEILTVSRQDVGDGWWEGVNTRGQTGLFPAGYVEVVNETNSGNAQCNSQSSFDAADADWGDDDWDDDDDSQTSNTNTDYAQSTINSGAPHTSLQSSLSSATISSKQHHSQQQQPTVRKSFNRFSTFVKSGGEDYILGIKTMNVKDESYIFIVEVEGQYKWAPNEHPYACVVEKPKKETKMKGLKSFIAYQLTPSITNIQVSRRYKHFDWLHERLQDKFTTIPIPALPDKQISGRYQEEFIEHRRTQLQSWVNRICRHPVLSQSDVWMHFIICTADEKRWKNGKRKAEKDELVGASLFFAIQPPYTGSALDVSQVDRKMDHFYRFVLKMDDAVKHLFNTAQDQSKKFIGPYKREFSKIANSIGHISAAFDLSGLDSAANENLNSALRHTSNTYETIGKLYEEQPKYDFGPLSDTLHEYKGILTAWPEILQVHKGALNKKREHQKLMDEGKIDNTVVTQINQRADVVTYSTLAEINHFQDERIVDFKNAMQEFLRSQIIFYKNIGEKLQQTLDMYNNV